jgi:hypothetical protein
MGAGATLRQSLRYPEVGWARLVSDQGEIIATHLSELDERWRSTVERLIEVVFEALPDADHERKWGQLTFTREGDWHHWICAISPTRKAVKLVIHKGALLADPRGLMIGAGRYSRAIPFREPEEIDADVVTPILREAAARQTAMWPTDAA